MGRRGWDLNLKWLTEADLAEQEISEGFVDLENGDGVCVVADVEVIVVTDASGFAVGKHGIADFTHGSGSWESVLHLYVTW